MIDKLFTYLSIPQKYCVIGVYEFDDQVLYSSLTVRISKNEIQLISKELFHTESELLNIGISKTDAILFHLEGSTIITREIEGKSLDISSLIYNGNEGDFFFYEYLSENDNFVSFTRKDSIRSWIRKIEKRGGVITGISIGPMVVCNLFQLLPEIQIFSTPSGTVSKKGDKLVFKQESSETFHLQFEGEKLNKFEVPLIATIIGYNYPGTTFASSLNDIENNTHEVKYRKAFKTMGVAFLTLFLFLIIFGHFYLNSISNELVENEAHFLSFQQNLDRISLLKEERDVKLKILQTSGVFKNDYLTGYLLDICNSLPEEIRLTDIEVFPLENKMKPEEKPEFNFDVIKIKGVSPSEKDINNWLGTLQKIEWQRKVEIISFEKEGHETFKFHFKILL